MNSERSPSDDSRSPWLSVIVPTRGRPIELRRLIENIEATTAHPEAVELILVTDLDDPTASDLPQTQRIPLQQRKAPPGLTIGALVRAGFDCSRGDWLMLLSDDVVVRTKDWDQKARQAASRFADEISLVQVNDGIFGNGLCTFPIISRTFTHFTGGICRQQYNRYCVDDDIYNIFELLKLCGYGRIQYLEDVLFEHLHRDLTVLQGPQYRPNPVVHERDKEIYESFVNARVTAALDLIRHIETSKTVRNRNVLGGQSLASGIAARARSLRLAFTLLRAAHLLEPVPEAWATRLWWIARHPHRVIRSILRRTHGAG